MFSGLKLASVGNNNDNSTNNKVGGSLFGMMAEHMASLNTEVEPTLPSSSENGGDPQPQVAVIGSACPQKDVDTIQWLLPQKFGYEIGKEAIVMFEDGDNRATGLTVMIVDCRTSGQDIPIHWKNGTVVLDEKEIILAVERCNANCSTASVVFRDSFEVARNINTTLAVIRLSGGANLVMMSAPFLQSHLGRQHFCDFVTCRDKIESLDRARESHAVQEDNLLAELEDEFDVGRRRRRVQHQPSMAASDEPGGEEAAVVPARNFPMLGLSLLRKHGFMQQDVPINALKEIPFETDLFVGKMQVLIRPKHPEDNRYHYEQVFSKTKVNFVLQVQGKLKYNPQGRIYAGLELNGEMKPALLMRGLCSVILRHVQKKHPNMRHSFGDDKERPHIVAPAVAFFDRFHVTKDGSYPPNIAEPLKESTASIQERQSASNSEEHKWSQDVTYSFACMTECIDFPYWQLVGMNFVRDTDLRNFWGNNALRLVIYEHRPDDGNESKHMIHQCHHLFALQIHHLEDALEASKKKEDETEVEPQASLTWGKIRKSVRHDGTYEPETNGDESLERLPSQEEEYLDSDEEDTKDDLIDDTFLESDRQSVPSRDILITANKHCPGWVDVLGGKNGKYTRVYAFPSDKAMIFRTSEQFKRCISPQDAAVLVRSRSSPRISQPELHRRVMGVAYAEILKQRSILGRQLGSIKNYVDQKFLNADGSRPKPVPMKAKVLMTECIARCLSERHWKEEIARLFEDHIAFFHPDRLNPEYRIYFNNIQEVKRVKDEDAPQFLGFSFLEIGMLGRTTYLMFASEKVRNKCVETLNKQMEKIQTEESKDNIYVQIDDPTYQFLHDSSIWGCQGGRRILNCRKYQFGGAAANSNKGDPSELVDRAMHLAQTAQKTPTRTSLIKFLDCVASMNAIDVYALDEEEKTCFFLNLYHLMIMHCYLLLGPPENSFKAAKMYGMVSYQMSDDVFSIAELEHNVIRGAMCFPSQVGTKFSLPKSKFDFCLATKDYRVNFALNRGSVSQPETVPIYKTGLVDRQLQTAAMKYMNKLKIDKEESSKVVLELPRLCLWYSDDFGSFKDMIAKVESYAGVDGKKLINEVDKNEKNIRLKYLPFDFHCRPIGLEGEMMDICLDTDQHHHIPVNEENHNTSAGTFANNESTEKFTPFTRSGSVASAFSRGSK